MTRKGLALRILTLRAERDAAFAEFLREEQAGRGEAAWPAFQEIRDRINKTPEMRTARAGEIQRQAIEGILGAMTRKK
jgi:hypothetical protein